MAAVVVEREQLYRRKWRFYRRESSEGALLWGRRCAAVGWLVRRLVGEDAQLWGRGCAGVGAWAWLRVSVAAQLWVRGCAGVVAEDGRVQAVCCS